MDIPARIVSGLTQSANALFVAAAAQARPHGVVLYVVPSDGDLEQSVADVAFFLAALEGLPVTAAERAVLAFPSHEVDPYRGLAPHVGVTSARARALHGIGRGTARVVVASAAGLLPRVTAPERLLAASLELKPGQDISPTDLAELLVDAGFSGEDARTGAAQLRDARVERDGSRARRTGGQRRGVGRSERGRRRGHARRAGGIEIASRPQGRGRACSVRRARPNHRCGAGVSGPRSRHPELVEG